MRNLTPVPPVTRRSGRTTVLLLLGVSLLGLAALAPRGAAALQAGGAITRGAQPALVASEVDQLVRVAAGASAGDRMAVTVVDRAGRVLAVWHRVNATDAEAERSLSLARTGAFFANNQAPLSSRTVRFISGIHFPPGVKNQPSAPLYGIENTNRVSRQIPYEFGKEYPEPLNLEQDGPSLGISTGKVDLMDSSPRAVDAGGFPVYKNGQVVGGVGVSGVDPLSAEWAAFLPTVAIPGIQNPYDPRRDVIFADGIALPFVAKPLLNAALAGRQPRGVRRGTFADGNYRAGFEPRDGGIAPDGYLVRPAASPELSEAEVTRIVDQSLAAARATRALIRLPLGSRTRMVIAVGDLNGNILAVYRMQDSTIFSIDVAVAKARNVVYFSGPDRLRSDLPGLPIGTAVTNRSISFGAQPLFPSGIDNSRPGPFFDLFKFDTQNPGTQGADSSPNPKNGIVFFPGSIPLYKDGRLVGGLGISGDGVEQDDFVAHNGAKGFLPPRDIRADNYRIRGVRIPFLKFPRNPLD